MKKLKKHGKIWLCMALALLLCAGCLSIGVSALQSGDYGNTDQRDDLFFGSLFPENCEHTDVGDWEIEAYPGPGTNGQMVTRCTVCQTVTQTKDVPYLKFQSASLSLTDNMTLRYKVSASLLSEGGYTNPYVTFVMNGRTVAVSSYKTDGDYLVFSFEDVAPHTMNDNIAATLYATLGGTVCESAPQNYSIATYCYSSLSKYSADSFAELRTLLVDLLNYGAAVQTYVGYKTDDLANAALTETQRAWGTATDRTLVSTLNTSYVTRENTTVTWKGAGLTLQESIAIRYKIDATDVTGMTAKVLSTNGTRTIDASEFEATDGGHYIYFDWLSAAQMSETVYITIYDANGAISNTLSFSVESYAAAIQSFSNADLTALARAMMRYGDAAKAYENRNVTEPEVPEGGWGENDQQGWTKPY